MTSKPFFYINYRYNFLMQKIDIKMDLHYGLKLIKKVLYRIFL